MTGLANRRALDEWLETAMVEWREKSRPVGLVVCDFNGLKRINDEQGHDAGDRALVQFAKISSAIQQAFEGAMVARFGGDEFCFAMSGPQVPELPRRPRDLTPWVGVAAVRGCLRCRVHAGGHRPCRESRCGSYGWPMRRSTAPRRTGLD